MPLNLYPDAKEKRREKLIIEIQAKQMQISTLKNAIQSLSKELNNLQDELAIMDKEGNLHCDICNSRTLIYSDFEHGYLANPASYRVYRCETCGYERRFRCR